MRALILSDIHANLQALQAVLAQAPPHDVVWNLGDIVGYGANPNEVIDAVRPLGTTFVRGNHDRACSGLTDVDGFNPVASRAAKWTQCVLSSEHTAWLRHLPQGPVMPAGPVSADVPANGAAVRCAHGSLLDEDEYVLSARDALHSLTGDGAAINFFGHTHLQGGFATDGEQWYRLAPDYFTRDTAETWELQLSSGARYMLNPGSVGQPRDGNWRAAFAIYDTERHTVLFCRVPYDLRSAQDAILRAGLPDRLASRLRDGR
ncbi:metallophosphoesterase [Acidipila sp. EB88]|uniref:metallophosphoesterase family protein n=1 Tax=Acidipila sp. EB88 TaxID=2305226 RepID=UPI000F5FC7A8|nr:metallophosphoesterase family protein [Acidipila sp. EB88]RRA48132.1 metallophosphoesterase [Acidipila sp. EB88]